MITPNDELELRRRLRQLPREREPRSDLWGGIEARLGTGARTPAATPRRPWVGMALAAALVLGVALGVLWRPSPNTNTAPSLAQTSPTDAREASNRALQREAEAITLEYRLAIDSLASLPLPPELQAATAELDASAAQLREALNEQPEATYLLDRLRRTYDQRLKLTQRTLS
jgi:hypothetical protein